MNRNKATWVIGMDNLEFEQRLAKINEKVDQIEPARPPTKQAVIDAMLPKLEDRIKLGVTLDQLNEAIFEGEISTQAFSVMLRRARAKRDNKTGTDGGAAASLQPAETPVSPSAGSRASRGGSPTKGSPGKGSAVAASQSESRPVAASAADKGEGGSDGGAAADAGTEAALEAKDARGNPLVEQSDEIPPMDSDEPVTKMALIDARLPNIGVLEKCKTWFQVHFYLREFAPGGMYNNQEPNHITLEVFCLKMNPKERSRQDKMESKAVGLGM